MITPAQYSRKRLRSLRAAMADVLADYLLAQHFATPDGAGVQLAQVFPEWPDPEDNYVTPSATILPGAGEYEEAGNTPTLLEETWEPQGQPGLGLYKLSELVVPYEIQVRTPTSSERDVLVGGIEELWVAKGVLMDHQEGARYGILIDLPEYWGVTAVFSLLSMTTQDDADSAMRNHRQAILRVVGRAPSVKLGPVQPAKVTIKLVVTP